MDVVTSRGAIRLRKNLHVVDIEAERREVYREAVTQERIECNDFF